MKELQPVICRKKRNGCVAVSHRVEGADECPVELCVAAATGHVVMPAEDAAQRATGESPVQGDVGCDVREPLLAAMESAQGWDMPLLRGKHATHEVISAAAMQLFRQGGEELLTVRYDV